MIKSMTIQGTQFQVKEYKGKRVVTFKDIDAVHRRPEGTAHRNFKANRQRFISGVDFFQVKPSDFQRDEIRPTEINNNGTTLITESGYLMLVKSFTDDLAWKVQRDLVDTYFRVRKTETEEPIAEEQSISVSAIRPEIFLEAARIMASVPDSKQNVINCLRHVVPDIDDAQTVTVQMDDKVLNVPVIEDRVMMIQATDDRSYSKPFNSAQFDNYLVENKIKIYRLAVKLGCTDNCVSQWRYGKTKPQNCNRIKLCEALGLPIGYFDNKKRVRRIPKS